MAGTVRLVMNVAGFNAYRNSASVTAAIEALAEDVAKAAQANVEQSSARHIPSDGQDVIARTKHTSSRVRAYVSTRTERGQVAEHVDRALNRAIQAHGGGGAGNAE